MNRKIILIIFLVVVVMVGAIGYFSFVNNSTHLASKEECEQKTGKQCYLFKGLCQVGEAQNQKEAEENEKFLKECLSKIGTWQPIETVSQATSDVSNWETYRSEEHRFEIKYPSDFTEQKIKYDADSISAGLLSATRADNVCSYYFNINIRKNYKINNIFSSVKDAKEINIGNSLGYEYFFTEGVGYTGVALVQVGQDQLSITLDCIGKNSTPNNQKKSDIQDFFNQILSTFKFTK